MCIQSDANNAGTTISEVIVRGKRDKQNRNWFYFIFLLKARVSYLTIIKRKNLSLPLKDETGQFVTCLVLSVSFCQNCISPSNSEANRDGTDAESPLPLFFSLSASFKNSSPREKVGNCLRFGTGGWSLCFYPLLSRNIWIFFSTLTMATRALKKISGKAVCSRNQSALSRFGARLRILNLIA